jgi:GT2 family glycosyltransferase
VDHDRIDVGIPVYRGGEHIAATLQSLVDQTHKNFSALISVDGGDPESAEVCRPFLRDSRFRLVVQEQRLGWAGNLNWLVSRSDGAFFCYYQQDDVTAPTYFEELIAAASQHPSAAIVFSDLQFFGDDQQGATAPSITGDVFSRVLKQLEAFSHTPFRGLIRAKALREAPGGLRLTEHESFGEDFVWVLKLTRAGDLINVPKALYFKRRHAESTSRAWFETWPLSKRRDALIKVCVGLIDAVLPAAQTNAQRFQLLYAVLERLALHQWFYPTKRLSPDERRHLVTDFMTELRAYGETDVAQTFQMDWDLLTNLSLRRFGLREIETAIVRPATTYEEEVDGGSEHVARAIEDARHCLMAKLSYRLGDSIDFSGPDSRRYMHGDWGDPEPWGVWTHGKFADLLLWPEAAMGQRLTLHFCLKPFFENVGRQRLTVSIDGVDVGVFLFDIRGINADRPRWCEISFSPDTLASRPLRVSFALPDLPAPASLGLPADAPVLGMGFIQARIAVSESK